MSFDNDVRRLIAWRACCFEAIKKCFFSISILQIIITAMDRFVWFVLLVVMTHLVTEFTRVTGYARGQRHEMVLLNDVSMTRQYFDANYSYLYRI